MKYMKKIEIDSVTYADLIFALNCHKFNLQERLNDKHGVESLKSFNKKQLQTVDQLLSDLRQKYKNTFQAI